MFADRARFLTYFAAAALVATLGAGSAAAQSILGLHAIDGRDLNLPQALPVDLDVDGTCVTDLTFGNSAGPVAGNVGPNPVKLYLNDGPSCGGTLVASTTVNLTAFTTVLAVAHLDQNGAIQLQAFSVPTAAVPAGRTSVSILHLAQAPKVDVFLRSGRSKAFVDNIANGEQAFPADLRAGRYDVRVSPERSFRSLLKLRGVPLEGNLAVVAAGTLANGTFTLLPVALP